MIELIKCVSKAYFYEIIILLREHIEMRFSDIEKQLVTATHKQISLRLNEMIELKLVIKDNHYYILTSRGMIVYATLRNLK